MNTAFLEMPGRSEIELSEVLQALGDPVRLEIVRALAQGERACGSFPLPVAESTRSHHLRVLRKAGVTATRIKGTSRLVSLRRTDLEVRFPGLLDSVLGPTTQRGRARVPA